MAQVAFSGSVIEGLEYESWLGLAAPRNLAPEAAARLTDALRAAVRSPAFVAKMAALGADAKEGTPAEFRSRVEHDVESFKRIVSARSIPRE
jgi:tripartite-type tricarboxylate transporter receptor subunit TctC